MRHLVRRSECSLLGGEAEVLLDAVARPRARTLQAMRASLLASAIASTLGCSRCRMWEVLMRYKPKNVAALHLALGGLPDQMRVNADPEIGVSAKTVGELRK